MKLTVGKRLASTVCETEVIVLRTGSDDVSLTCGGAPMTDVTSADAHRGGSVTDDGGTSVGKRYVDADQQLELLCTKAGAGALAVDGVPLVVKAAKVLPSSD